MAHYEIDVSVIILNYRNKGLIREQLRYFSATARRLSSEVIVVDNDSHDDIEQMLRVDFPSVRFIQSGRNGGFAFGNNKGIQAARGRYIVICNPDIVLAGTTLESLVAFMDQHPRTGIAGPALRSADDSLQYSCMRFPDLWMPLFRRTSFAATRSGTRWLDRYLMKDYDHASARMVDWIFGALLIVRHDAIDRVGTMDEGFFMYLEDTDWCRRFWDQGWEVWYVPEVSVIHLHQRSSEGGIRSVVFNKLTRVHNISFLRYLWKYRGRRKPHDTDGAVQA